MGHRLVNSANCKPKDQGEAIEHYLQNPLRCQNVSEFDRMKSAVYPGSFDPFTNGHLDIVNRALKVVDEITIAVLNNSSKKNLFTPGERVELIQQVFARHERVKVDQLSGLLVDYCRSNGKTIVVRGLRTVNDFDYEHAISLVNQKLFPEFETMFLMAKAEFSFISSSIVKEVASLGGNIDEHVPLEISQKLKQVYNFDIARHPKKY